MTRDELGEASIEALKNLKQGDTVKFYLTKDFINDWYNNHFYDDYPNGYARQDYLKLLKKKVLTIKCLEINTTTNGYTPEEPFYHIRFAFGATYDSYCIDSSWGSFEPYEGGFSEVYISFFKFIFQNYVNVDDTSFLSYLLAE